MGRRFLGKSHRPNCGKDLLQIGIEYLSHFGFKEFLHLEFVTLGTNEHHRLDFQGLAVMRPEIKLKACIDQTLMHLVEVLMTRLVRTPSRVVALQAP